MLEKRLIDVDVAEKSIRIAAASVRASIGCGYDEGAADALSSVADMLKTMPTVAAVELPCKVGDMVYRKDGVWNVVGFDCDRTGSWRVKLERWKDQFRDYHESTKVVFGSFGKTMFLTRAAAAAALAKMEVEK